MFFVTIQREALKALSSGRGLGEGNKNKEKFLNLDTLILTFSRWEKGLFLALNGYFFCAE